MPLNEYPFDGSWGYQCSGYFSATSRYGSAQELMYLINACHRANIGIIMDFVPVHFVRDDFSLSYFDGTPLYEYEKACDADSQWGTANFNLWREEVRSFLMSAAAFWIDKYHVDGLRMDAISNIIHWHGNKDLGENEGALHFIKRMNYHLSEAYKGVMLIAEDSSDFANVTKATQDGGLGFDYKWDLGWMNDTLKYLEKDPIYRKWHHNNITFSMAYFYSERFIMEFPMMRWYMERKPSSIRYGAAMRKSSHSCGPCIYICSRIRARSSILWEMNWRISVSGMKKSSATGIC